MRELRLNNDFENIHYKSIQGHHEGPHLLILAGVHGDEYEPIAAAIKLISIVPEVLTHGLVTIVPIVNVPAFKRASRVGEDGLNLARICPGNKTGTASEKIAAEVSELISISDYLIDLHGGGNAYEIAPLSGYMLHPSEEVLHKQRQMAHAFNLQTIWGTSSKLEGRTLSVARDHHVPAIYTEYGGGGGFKKEIVKAYVQGCLNIIHTLGMLEGNLPSSRCDYIVEDYREESGHLQIMLPASSNGFFEAEVKLGDFVKKGQQIGTITDLFSQTISPVCADQDGMVFLLRAIPAVEEGDALGGVLPVTQPGKVTIS
jgi:predicted deacylase